MKKVISIILSALLIVGCSSTVWASQSIYGEADINQEKALEGTITYGNDDDGCYVITLDGEYMGQAMNYLLQIGSSGLVFGQDGSNIEISTAVIAEALEGIAASASEESSAVMDYLGSDDFQADMQVITETLSGEMTRLVMLANQSGLVVVDDAGNVTITANTESLIALLADYASALAENSTVFETLSATKLWSMLGLSEGGKTEQEMTAAIAEQLKNADASALGMDIEFSMVAETSGNVEAECMIAAGEDSMNMHVSYDGASFSESVNINASGATKSMDMSFSETAAAYSWSMELDEIAMGCNLTLDLTTFNLDGTFTSDGQTVAVEGRLDNSSSDKVEYVITLSMDGQEAASLVLGMKQPESSASGSNVCLYVIMNGVEYDMDINVSQTDSGEELTAVISAVIDGEKTEAAHFVLGMKADEEVFAHQSGTEITADQLLQLFGLSAAEE